MIEQKNTKSVRYSEQERAAILKEFEARTSAPFTVKSIVECGGVSLFKKLTGRDISPGGIVLFLKKSKDPQGYKQKYEIPRKKRVAVVENALYEALKDAKVVLVPSIGDIARYDTFDEAKKAVEECTIQFPQKIEIIVLEPKKLKIETKISVSL